MMASIASLIAGPVTITGSDAVKKSYPGFYKDIELLGATVQEG